MRIEYKILIYILFFECIILLLFNFTKTNDIKRLFNTQIPNDLNNFKHKNSVNIEQCHKQIIEAHNEIAVTHYKNGIKRNLPDFDACYLKMKDPNIFLINDKPNETFSIRIDYDLLLQRYELKNVSIQCYYQIFDKKIDTKERSSSLLTSYRKKINDNLIVTNSGFYHISCNNKLNDSLIHEDLLVLLPQNMSLLKQKTAIFFNRVDIVKEQITTDSKINPMLNDLNLIDDIECKTENKAPKMNVLMIGIDSLSFPHLKRSFPRFYKYLRDDLENNVLFENFNKIGENTHPNLLSLFAGVKIEKFLELGINDTDIDYYMENDSTYHDQIPFVWRSFEKIDYLTLYNEEWSHYGCFNYLKNGFRYYPAHYYTHPYWFKYDTLVKRHNKSKLCLNNEPTYSKSLNNIKQLIDRLNDNNNKKLPYFSFNFLKYYTHDFFVTPAGFDAELASLIKNFEDTGYLNNTMLVMFSDHGSRLSRYGYYTEPGRLERSMPFLSVRLPQRLINTELHLNLKQNKDKLISMFDVYKTLKQFYYINKHGTETLLKPKCRLNFTISKPQIRSMRGVSLFERINSTRSCVDAIVPSSYCLCSSTELITEDSFKKEAGNFKFKNGIHLIKNRVNSMTRPQRSKCQVLKVDRVKSVKRVQYTSEIVLFTFEVILQPGDSIFEANIRFYNGKLQIYEDKIIRLSKYRDQSKCVANSKTRKLMGFCFCI